ncbi:MAG: divergent polysaccharide deacetylase family protein [Pseudomonadota bacterium]
MALSDAANDEATRAETPSDPVASSGAGAPDTATDLASLPDAGTAPDGDGATETAALTPEPLPGHGDSSDAGGTAGGQSAGGGTGAQDRVVPESGATLAERTEDTVGAHAVEASGAEEAAIASGLPPGPPLAATGEQDAAERTAPVLSVDAAEPAQASDADAPRVGTQTVERQPSQAPSVAANRAATSTPEPQAAVPAEQRVGIGPEAGIAATERAASAVGSGRVAVEAAPVAQEVDGVQPAALQAPSPVRAALREGDVAAQALPSDAVADTAPRLALSEPLLKTDPADDAVPVASETVAAGAVTRAALQPGRDTLAMAVPPRNVSAAPRPVAAAGVGQPGPAAPDVPETVRPASYPVLSPLRDGAAPPRLPIPEPRRNASVDAAEALAAVTSPTTGHGGAVPSSLDGAQTPSEVSAVASSDTIVPVAEPWALGPAQGVSAPGGGAKRTAAAALDPTPGARAAIASGTGALLVGTELPTPPGVVALSPQELLERPGAPAEPAQAESAPPDTGSQAPAPVALAQALSDVPAAPSASPTGVGASVRPLTQRDVSSGVRINRLGAPPSDAPQGGAAAPADGQAGTMPVAPRIGAPGEAVRRITVGTRPASTEQGASEGPEPDDTVRTTEGPAYLRNAVPFDGPQAGQSLLAVVLLDPANDEELSRKLAALDLPVAVAIAPEGAAVAAAAKIYAGAQKEVVLAGGGLPEGATPQDAEVAFSVHFATVPNALGVLAPQSGGFAADRDLAQHVLQILAADGHGVVLWDQGLSPLRSQAERSARPRATIYRQIDSREAGVREIARRLDRAAFEARRGDGVVVVGEARPETLDALQTWANRARGGEVVFAPLSALMQTR